MSSEQFKISAPLQFTVFKTDITVYKIGNAPEKCNHFAKICIVSTANKYSNIQLETLALLFVLQQYDSLH
jgi:hypothetical protein